MVNYCSLAGVDNSVRQHTLLYLSYRMYICIGPCKAQCEMHFSS